MNTPIPWISQVLAASITAVATVVVTGLSIYFGRRIPSVDRNHSKRLTVIELAKRRLEVRDQALQLELAATENGSAEQEEAKVRARQAVQKIISDGDAWMKYLEWESQITRVARAKEPHTDRVLYWFLILCGLVFRTIAVVAIVSFVLLSWISVYNPKSWWPLLGMALSGVFAVMFMWLWRTFSQEVQKLKFPRPDAPILDEL